jgi:hypothetical protein
MHDVAGEGIIATSPVTGSDWILTDIVGHALRATDTTVDIQQATFTRTGGLYADGGALRLSDTRLAAIGFEAIAVHVSDGTLDAERLECDGADTACISLMNAGGSLRDVRIRATPLPIVQWGCSDRTPPLDITAYFCEDCVDPTVHRCDGVQP